MKIKYLTLLVVVPAFMIAGEKPLAMLTPQDTVNRIGLYGGMGVHGTIDASVVDYLNNLNRSMPLYPKIATSVEFFGGTEVSVSRTWALKIEYSYLFKSYSLVGTTFGTEDLSYAVNAPLVIAQYVIPGRRYFFRFGAGAGYHWGTIAEKQSIYGIETFYKAHGIGVRVEAEGQTAFDDHLYGYISTSAGFEALGTAKSDAGGVLTNGGGAGTFIYPIGPVKLNYGTAGIRFGLMYYLN